MTTGRGHVLSVSRSLARAAGIGLVGIWVSGCSLVDIADPPSTRSTPQGPIDRRRYSSSAITVWSSTSRISLPNRLRLKVANTSPTDLK